jgi:hypothetical protein
VRQSHVAVPAKEHLNNERGVQKEDSRYAGRISSLDRNRKASLVETEKGCASVRLITDKSKEKRGVKVEGENGLVWRDEWECGFCGPECFCWTVDTKVET